MTGQLLQIARDRFLAASQAWFIVANDGAELRVERERVYLLKPTGAPQLATVMPAPWDTVIGIVFEYAATPGATIRYRRLVPIGQILGLTILD